MVIGCAMGQYESLAGGLIAASAALFAGWLAWSGVQKQIASEERRAAADREEAEKILQQDTHGIAEALGEIRKILEHFDPKSDPAKMSGIVRGLELIALIVGSGRKMVDVLGWERRRLYEQLFDESERLARFRNPDTFDRNEALMAVRAVSVPLELVRSGRLDKFWTVGHAIEVLAGIANESAAKPNRDQPPA